MAMKRALLMSLLVVASLLLAAGDPAYAAQCAMCKQALASSGKAAELVRGMNLAVLVLLIPPVAIFAGIFGVFYRFRGVQGRREPGEDDL
jgi:hypothetical protein